ncbi:MAG TPA: site-2 protease family protein [Spirochaetota bacterium]|mgnify:CR=1 FL=1|nr:site-2 protease family protein [Spirochaetota bacterium]HPC39371.1 site-2 protease family protein [Spirochaetota bacterium]HPL18646.1 site-2 protease family protein [Spirochaetota bacterium]HQF08691.1 site-2 protease family protein [Spirochaetota bacterium]HQH97608.1 site-2 protease family protein [Spirochaetota bacterium]
MRIPDSIIEWVRNYLTSLNTGNRPRRQHHDFLPEQRIVKKRPAVNILLFVITFLSTTFAGASESKSVADAFVSGLPYSITLIFILLVHEFGHYCAARRFGVDATLPYFIPFPSIIGTMGAVIKTRTPIPDRRALFYIGAMGPLPGFIMSLAAVVAGIYLSDVRPLPVVKGDMMLPVFGDSLLFAFLVRVIHGAIPAGKDIYLSPYAWAGWIGFLITSLNLMPIGQLDGSHILYALIGKRQKVFGWLFLAGLCIMSFIWQGWIVWIVLTLFFLMVAHPEIPEDTPLTMIEKIIGWTCMVILIVTFVPIPVDFL